MQGFGIGNFMLAAVLVLVAALVCWLDPAGVANVATLGSLLLVGMSYLPGQRDVQSVTEGNCLASTKGVMYGRGVIDAARAYDGANTGREWELKPGIPMGRITASKLWVPCKRTQANGAGTTITALIVDNARAFRAGDEISVDGTNNTVSSVNYSTNTITLGTAQSWADNAVVIGRGNCAGAETCRGFLNETLVLRDKDDATWYNVSTGKIVIAGMIANAKVLGDLAAIRGDTAAEFNAILFDDEQGQA